MAAASVDFFQVPGSKPVNPGPATSASAGARGAVEAFEQIVASFGGPPDIAADAGAPTGTELSVLTAQSARPVAPRPMVSCDVEKAMTAGLLAETAAVDMTPADTILMDGALAPPAGSQSPALPVGAIEPGTGEPADAAPADATGDDASTSVSGTDPAMLMAAAVPVPVIPAQATAPSMPVIGEGKEPVGSVPAGPRDTPQMPIVPEQQAGTIVPTGAAPLKPLLEGRAAAAAPAPERSVTGDVTAADPATDNVAVPPPAAATSTSGPPQVATSVPVPDIRTTEPSIPPVAGPAAGVSPAEARPVANAALSSQPAPADAATIANTAGVTSVRGSTTPAGSQQPAAPVVGTLGDTVTPADAKPIVPTSMASPGSAETVDATSTTAKAAAEAVSAIAPEAPKTAIEDAKSAPAPVPQSPEEKTDAARPADVKSTNEPRQAEKSDGTGENQDKPATQPSEKPVGHADGKGQQLQQVTDAKPAAIDTGARPNGQTQPQGAVAIPALASEIVGRVKKGSSRFEIRLDPPELGRVDVRVDIDKNGNVHSRLIVEKTETLELLKSDQRALERALADAGFKTDQGSLSFSMRDDRGAQQQFQQNRALWESASRPTLTEEEPARLAAETAYRASARADGGLDLRV